MSLVECIPNFSEGRDIKKIEKIASAISSVEGVKLLNVDIGYDANRTVITFAGSVESVCLAAFEAVKIASELIDMSLHTGKHPRIGATDVLPIVPISGITLSECAEYARTLSKKIADELGIPVYCYEASAYKVNRQNLAICRAGEYEGLEQKMQKEGWQPDFGPKQYDNIVKKSGATVVGARNYLVAVNFNLDCKDTTIAKKIATQLREKGGEIDGETVRGTMKAVKAIGWYIEEYGFAQVSTNITDIERAPLNEVWKNVCFIASNYGVRVTGTEIIGLVPKKVLIDAGQSFLCCLDEIGENDIINSAIKELNLEQISSFSPSERIIEYLL